MLSKIRMYYADDIKTYYGNISIYDDNSASVDIGTEKFDKSFIKLIVSYLINGELSVFEPMEIKIEDKTLLLKNLKKIDLESEREFHRVEYKGELKLKKISASEKDQYNYKIEKQAFDSKNSLIRNIKELLPLESKNNQVILKFLLEINNKLDRIIELIESKELNEGFLNVKVLDISGGGLSFFSEERFLEGTNIFIEGEIVESYHKILLTAIGSIKSVLKTEKGFIYGANFESIDNDIKEEIIKFVFEKDRKIIKDIKGR